MRRDVTLAAVLAAAGVVEVLVGDGSVIAVLGATLPLAWRRTAPLVPVAAAAIALMFLVNEAATPLIALAIALYSAGRYVERRLGLVAAALGVVVATATRVIADPAAQSVGHAVLTLVAVSLPLLAGRWARGQSLLQRGFVQRIARLERDRERDAAAAAEEERMRIAGDLQAAIAGRLQDVVATADALPPQLHEPATARTMLAQIAANARDALADVRRVLGILRRDGEAPLTPPGEGRELPPPPDDIAPPAAPVKRGEPVWPDRLLAAAILVGAELELAFVADDHLLAALTVPLIAVPLLFRRRQPLLTAAAVFAAVALQSALLDLDAFPVSDIAAVVAATYAIAAHSQRTAAIAGLAGALAFAATHSAIFYPDGVAAALLGGVTAPWIAGRVIRGNRQLTQEGREDAAAAERARQKEARAAVTAERMRVARELHDAVAHNISVIAIQAGGADGIVERDPERTRQIVVLIKTVAEEARAELARLVGAVDAAPPSLAQVDALAARAREAGQRVEIVIEGQPAPLPRGLDLAAYRIVQEALANAAKYAAGARARVMVRYDARALEVEVADDGGQGVGSGNGHGLIGIEERVALYGGTLQTGRRPTGGFRVHARLPLP